MKKRIVEVFGDFDNPSKRPDNTNEIKKFVEATSGKECEFGYFAHSMYGKENLILFWFQKDICETIKWGCENVDDDFLETHSISYGFVSKIQSGHQSLRESTFHLPIEFSILKGKNPILILHLSSIIEGEIDKTISMTPTTDVAKAIFDSLEPIFAWVKLCKKIQDLNRLDMDVINDLFSESFDDAEDYAIASINKSYPIKAYEIAITTKTIKDGEFIDIDSGVSNLLRDILNIVSHLEEYNVTVSFNTSHPTRARFPDKNETFYKSIALIVRILPKIGS